MSLAKSSQIRDKALICFQKIDRVATKYIQHASIRYVVDRFIRPRIEGLIKFTVPENELKEAMKEVYYEIRPIIEDYEISSQINQSKKLNSPEMTRKLMQLPDFKDLEELLSDA